MAVRAMIKQSIQSKAFLAAMLGMALVLLFCCLQEAIEAFRSKELLELGFHMQLLFTALKSNGMALALPVLAALPYTTAYLDDVKSGYLKAYLPRAGVKGYIAGKLTACALSGSLALLLGALIAAFALTLTFLPKEALGRLPEGQVVQLMEMLLLLMANGALWSLCGFLLAALTGSRHMAYAGPFVLFYVLVILHERYFEKLYVLYPKEWISPGEHWVLGSWGAALFVMELCAVLAILFALWAPGKLVEA